MVVIIIIIYITQGDASSAIQWEKSTHSNYRLEKFLLLGPAEMKCHFHRREEKENALIFWATLPSQLSANARSLWISQKRTSLQDRENYKCFSCIFVHSLFPIENNWETFMVDSKVLKARQQVPGGEEWVNDEGGVQERRNSDWIKASGKTPNTFIKVINSGLVFLHIKSISLNFYMRVYAEMALVGTDVDAHYINIHSYIL